MYNSTNKIGTVMNVRIQGLTDFVGSGFLTGVVVEGWRLF